jgi:hypothetical protein
MTTRQPPAEPCWLWRAPWDKTDERTRHFYPRRLAHTLPLFLCTMAQAWFSSHRQFTQVEQWWSDAFIRVSASAILAIALLSMRDSILAARQRDARITPPPGQVLRRLAEFFCSKKSRQQVFEPLLTDMASEHCDALAAGRPWKARWMVMLYTFAFWRAVGLHAAVRLIASIWKVAKS